MVKKANSLLWKELRLDAMDYIYSRHYTLSMASPLYLINGMKWGFVDATAEVLSARVCPGYALACRQGGQVLLTLRRQRRIFQNLLEHSAPHTTTQISNDTQLYFIIKNPLRHFTTVQKHIKFHTGTSVLLWCRRRNGRAGVGNLFGSRAKKWFQLHAGPD